jgi:glycosyltransferase involved in cell wall biosynthesis
MSHVREAVTANLHVHVPTPGDHYSPATGSAVMTIIHELARVHARHGGETQIVVSRGTRHDYDLGNCIEVEVTPPPKTWQKVADVALARARLPRPFSTAAYRPATTAIQPDFTGPIFIHNSPAAVRLFRRRFPGAQVCLWAHNDLFGTYSRSEILHVLSAATRIICVSTYIKDQLLERLGPVSQSVSRKLRVVFNGVDVDRFRPAAPLREASARPIVLFVGRIVPVKGVDLLIQAAERVKRAGHEFELRIVGSSGFSATEPLSTYEQELRRLAGPIKNIVTFKPFTGRSEVGREYQTASISAVPSKWNDPCPLTMLEGLASGLAMVVSRRGGIPEGCGDAALYFDPPNADALAIHLASLLEDAQLRGMLAERARARAELFSWQNQYRCLLGCLAPDGCSPQLRRA